MEFLDIIIYLGILLLVYFIGTLYIEKNHFKDIKKREEGFLNLPTLSTQNLKGYKVKNLWLVAGSTVISIDIFKKFVAELINIFGGSVVSYESLLDRARRESILRLQQKAKDKGANAIMNLRIETSSISKGNKNNKVGAVEILAYATAVEISKEGGI